MTPADYSFLHDKATFSEMLRLGIIASHVALLPLSSSPGSRLLLDGTFTAPASHQIHK